MEYVIALIVMVVVAGLGYLVLDTLFSEEHRVNRRLRMMSAYEEQQAKDAEPLLRPFRQRILRPAADSTSRLLRAFAPVGYRARVKKRLTLAGNPQQMGAERFIAIEFLSVVGLLGVFIAIALVRSLSPALWLLGMIAAVGLGYLGPNMWLSGRVSDRQTAIRRSLPDMLDMLTISVEAGLGFDAAISKLVRNAPGPLAEEFGRMLQEVQAGASRSDALRRMSERTQVPELNAFIMAIIQAEVFGISISSVLRTQAVEMRTKRRQTAEEQAQKAPVKLVFPLVLCILPATMIVILGPAVLAIGKAFGLINY